MRSFFFVVIVLVMTINVSWYVISDYWLRKDLINYPRAKKFARGALLLWMSIVFIPIIGMSIPGLGNPLEYGPWLWLAIFYLWMGSIFFWMIGMALVGLPIWGSGKLAAWWQKRQESQGQEETTGGTGQEAESIDEGATIHEGPVLSRRQLLRLGLVATPPLLVSGAAGVSWLEKRRLNVYTQNLPVRELPPDLDGLTITHLSDIHIGMLTGRERVESMVAAANSLKSDLTVVTGDILDQDIAFLPDLVDTIGTLQAPLGVYLCIGNHDKIYDAQQWVETVRQAKLNLLLDEATLIDTGKTPLKLLGIDFAQRVEMDQVNIRRADDSLPTPEGALKVLLAHHPHAFDATAGMDIPVTLAGHTHGGQIVARIGEDLEIFNPGRYLFRYVDGIYRSQEGQSLFVHKGSGDWFPLRIGAPAEIVQLKLVPEEQQF